MSTATKDTEEKHGRSATKGQSRNEAKRIMRELELLCETVGPGGRIPRHTELMSRYGVSQHHVIRSLEELQRQGRIVRRHGS
jgi:DNA-binding GntR family transcriptional regulator